MNDLLVKSILAGIFFGTWPMIMNKSKLPGSISAIAFCVLAGLTVLPFAFKDMNRSLTAANWKWAILAGFIAGVGLLLFNLMVAKATKQTLPNLFVVNLLVQISVPAIYSLFVTGKLSPSRGLGFLAAMVAAILLK